MKPETAPAAVTLMVNGTERRLDDVTTLADVLDRLALDARMVVVELNRVIVRRPALAETPVHPGDRIELVHFVGGG